ncbi:hypothetical protein PRBRB14_25360 [Hallella multisaccharivorax DSM 17128]|nr:hypothetical protein PRBRB14_25360 [Hallella multisaccharivorax DSM 17128]
MIMTENELSNYPSSYILCFVDGCKLKDNCIHYLAGQHVRDDDNMGYAVYPSVLKSADGCKWHKEYRVIKSAWGFDTLFHSVLQRHAATLRQQIKDYLGGNGTYSRYNRGERRLTPEQQEWMIRLFQKYGYTTNLLFDHYEDAVDW